MINDDYDPSKLANFRDLGGIAVRTGVIVDGQIFRSDDLATVNMSEAERVASHGIGLIIDLRATVEAQITGRGNLASFEIDYINLPLTSDKAAPHELFQNLGPEGVTTQAMGNWYFQLFLNAAPVLIEALNLIAHQEQPVVFHCVAGKDRTGLLALSLLSVLEASRESIIHDYAETQKVMPEVNKRISSMSNNFSRDDMLKAGSMLRADAESFEIFFDLIDSSNSDVVSVLKAKGLSDEVISMLRSRYIRQGA
jgi:protein-tyrosine phosphatase